jgi:hypothetical protein
MKSNRFVAAALFASLFALGGSASAATSKAEYDAVKDKAKADYKIADDRCASLASNAKDVCKAEAKAAQKKADAMAEANYKGTPKARAEAAEEVAEADYNVAKEKCNAKTGNDKDVCVKEAKAAEVKAKADAKAMETTVTAQRDANADKRDADYKVAMEKCDGFSGAAKDDCQKAAKGRYGK